METLFHLAIALFAGFLIGWLLARNTWLTFEGRQMRRDMRVIGGLRIDLRAKDMALRETKKRYAGLLGEKRKLARQLRETQYGIEPKLGHLPPLEGSTCWKCSKPATTRLGDSMYCEDCVGQRAAP